MLLTTSFNRFPRLLFLVFLSAALHFNISSFAQAPAATDAPAPAAASPAAAPAGADPAMIAEGESLFKQNCKACHAINDVVVGPALKDLHTRRPLPWVIKFVHNSSKVIKEEKDPYAVALYEKFNKTEMTPFPGLSDQQIGSIYEWVKSQSAGVIKGPNEPNPPPLTPAPANDYSTITLILIVIVLILVLITLIVFITVLQRYLRDRESTLVPEDRAVVNQKFEPMKVIKSKAFIGIVITIFVAVSMRACWYGAAMLGVEQGYQPVQPIPFSHKLHAGQYKIDCNYCHTGVTKSKQAGIPSLNICMNCHSQIKKGPRFGEEAIKKVVDAYNNNRPIKWVRVHNLPDLAYFNHSQHVKVGGVECKTCHGPIDTMEVVRQFSPLTMGWCINCHRETAVNGKDNAYYDKLIKLHNSVSKKEMKVADIGGLECSKCHY